MIFPTANEASFAALSLECARLALGAIGPPLRPAAEDVRHVQQSVARFLPSEGATRRRALLLGVTPELARIAWEPPVQLLAVDKSQGMADGV